MGCISGRPRADPELVQRNREIERELERSNRAARNEIKLLLLGPGESGKSTIFRQMRIIQDNKSAGFTKEEINSWANVIWGNIITQMQLLLEHKMYNTTATDFENAENKQIAKQVMNLEMCSWNKQVGLMIKRLWQDKGVKTAFLSKDKKYQPNDSVEYFFDAIDRILDPETYQPTTQDIVRARVKTTGIEEATFEFNHMAFRLVDVGGQRSERRKWIHCFTDVVAILFCASLSEYDQVLREDHTQNRMKESLLLFDEICNSPWFREVSFILFLNKNDLFEKKIAHTDLTCCFPNYDGGCNADAARQFISSRFLEVVSHQSSHSVFVHFTVAVDTENVKFVWKAVRETLLKNVFQEIF